MFPEDGFAARKVYSSEEGLHIEMYSLTDAEAAYLDAKTRGINNVKLDGLVLTWQFKKPSTCDNSDEEPLPRR